MLTNLALAEDADNCATALAVDLADMSCLEVSVQDMTDDGCWIFSDKINLLKEQIGLRLEGRDKLVRGNIVAYGDSEAQISFKVKFEEPSEKRREIRRPVWITSVICGRTNPVSMKCRIVDASKSGCRLEGDKLDRLPEEIDVSIPGLDLPIPAQIIWRGNNQAGVRLDWPFDPEPKPSTQDKLKKLLEDSKKPEPKPEPKTRKKPKKRISAFGS
ncbi:PilZ domain protein [Roseibium album]|nr:PilZ domain protein [Roseibium album]